MKKFVPFSEMADEWDDDDYVSVFFIRLYCLYQQKMKVKNVEFLLLFLFLCRNRRQKRSASLKRQNLPTIMMIGKIRHQLNQQTIRTKVTQKHLLKYVELCQF